MRRYFPPSDVVKIFGLKPQLVPRATCPCRHDVDVKGLELKVPFKVESFGQNDHEVKDKRGNVFCRAKERSMALIVAPLSEGADCR